MNNPSPPNRQSIYQVLDKNSPKKKQQTDPTNPLQYQQPHQQNTNTNINKDENMTALDQLQRKQQDDKLNELQIQIMELKTRCQQLTQKLQFAQESIVYLSINGIHIAKQILKLQEVISVKSQQIVKLTQHVKQLMEQQQNSKKFIQLIQKSPSQQKNKIRGHRMAWNYDLSDETLECVLRGDNRYQFKDIKQILETYFNDLFSQCKNTLTATSESKNKSLNTNSKLIQRMEGQKTKVIKLVNDFKWNSSIKQSIASEQPGQILVKEEIKKRKDTMGFNWNIWKK